MAAANVVDAIQNKLVALAVAVPFPKIAYAVAGTGGAQSTDLMTTVVPKTVMAWQESTDFDLPALYRRGVKRERSTWVWLLQIHFDVPVSLVEFEKAMLESAIRVPRAPASNVDQQVDLLLTSAEYENPVNQQPARGTRATYRFTAQLTPY